MPGDALLRAAGSLRAAYEAVDWASTPLGPVETWTTTLRNAVDIALHTRFPVTLLWGPEFVLIYNEAYAPIIADKHPAALGRTAEAVFPEAWDTIGPLMRHVRADHGAVWMEDLALPLQRNGRLEEAYFTFSYSPVRNEAGDIEGLIDIAVETTRQVVDQRRMRLHGRLREALSDVQRTADIAASALPVLRGDPDDLPLVDLHLAGGARHEPRLPDAPARPLAGRGLVLEETGAGRVAWLGLGRGGPETEPLLVVGLSEHLAADEPYLAFLRFIASSLSQALDRVTVREAERAVAAAERSMSEALQRSLLTTPLAPDDLQIAVRYLPAAAQAEIGGDWYDSFLLPDGPLTLVIGDVSGHDRHAAAAMAQVRNLLRGIAYTPGRSPAEVLAGLDRAMHGLALDLVATAVLAQVEQDADQERHGRHVLRWSNAGHPPPVLLDPDGRARLLESTPDPLLGVAAGRRTDHTVELTPGASVLLYTDGLIERRGVALEERLDWLARALDGCEAMDAEQLCDHVLDQLDDDVDDDVALLVVHAPREDPGGRA
ncbi:serine/threonine-protein phosphatase [Baekduia soli]|uniref:Serine/threonine-protein phosphatase n=1 Tax=Baekduia soli TaxID=496014 RepID=A0A5B8U8R4_9ACTN|nr:PP2C family protein-serine/threonine phosphatase [Baekduia soli]QEC49390.1 serine/threonine-protein phosphatase [Baekduia soli]